MNFELFLLLSWRSFQQVTLSFLVTFHWWKRNNTINKDINKDIDNDMHVVKKGYYGTEWCEKFFK